MPHVSYFWDEMEDNVVEEYDGDAGDTIASYTTEPTLYGSVMSQDRSGEKRYFQFDGLGNTTELTDTSGNKTDGRDYTAFGELSVSTGNSHFRLQFCGARGYSLGPGPSQYYLRQRVYSPLTVSFLSMDAIQTYNRDDGTRYCYARNSPATRNDPSGALSQEEVSHTYDKTSGCGKYEWKTKWVPADNETDGYIVQEVIIRFRAKTCDKSRPMAIPLINACTGSKAPPGGVWVSHYIEIWRVVGKDVYFDMGPHPTQKAGNFHDVFQDDSHPNSIGCHRKFGRAVYVPAKSYVGLKEFKKFSVPNAGMLTAMCVSNAPAEAGNWLAKILAKYKGSKTEKSQDISWHCCGCTDKEDDQEHHQIGTTSKDDLAHTDPLRNACGK